MKKLLIVGAAGLVAAMGFATIAAAAAADPKSQTVPKGWNYEIKDGKRVAKANRQTNADGSWREENRQGKCVTVKEKSAAGEYKESRRCS
ncbi:MAG: hypothetical protein M3438_05795 [Pseudomonadota bacterium]|nr:hypothetical protein [Sphingomonas sp.]MDQ3478655.1 hypothetical protein [Pseudomonadota bacterium]